MQSLSYIFVNLLIGIVMTDIMRIQQVHAAEPLRRSDAHTQLAGQRSATDRLVFFFFNHRRHRVLLVRSELFERKQECRNIVTYS